MRKHTFLTTVFLLLLMLPSLCNAQGAPVRLELKPFPKPDDGVVRCKPGDEQQIQLVGYDADKQETSLNQYMPTATSSNQRAATAQVPANTGHTVILRCVGEGKALITASYGRASTNLDIEVGVVRQTSETNPQPSPSPSPTPQPSSQTTSQASTGYEIKQYTESFSDQRSLVGLSVDCPLGSKVLGGGAKYDAIPLPNTIVLNTEFPFVLLQSLPYQNQAVSNGSLVPIYGWSVRYKREANYTPKGKSFILFVYAICAPVQ